MDTALEAILEPLLNEMLTEKLEEHTSLLLENSEGLKDLQARITKQKEVIKAQKTYASIAMSKSEKSSCAPLTGDIIKGRTDDGGGSFVKLNIGGGDGLHHNRGDT